jgi:hypothetical protein
LSTVHARMCAEVGFSGGAEANAPLPRGHDRLFARAGNDLVGNSVEMAPKLIDAVELPERASVQCVKSIASGLAQEFQFGCILRLTLLDKAQTLAQYLAGVLVTAGSDQFVEKFLLMVCQHHVSSRHGKSPLYGILCQ